MKKRDAAVHACVIGEIACIQWVCDVYGYCGVGRSILSNADGPAPYYPSIYAVAKAAIETGVRPCI